MAPEKLENLFAQVGDEGRGLLGDVPHMPRHSPSLSCSRRRLRPQSPLVGSAIFVHGDSLHHALVAVVSVDAAAARSWAAANGLPADAPVATILADARLKKAVLGEFSRIAKVRAVSGGGSARAALHWRTRPPPFPAAALP